MFVLERNSVGRKLTGCFDRFCRFTGGGIAAGQIALIALGVLCLVNETTATATCVTALSLGWLLLVGALTVKRGSNQPSLSSRRPGGYSVRQG
jgi:hypothetical protein